MKKLLRILIVLNALVFLIGTSASGVALSGVRSNKQPDNSRVNIQMIKSQVGLFKDALDEFGATSPLRAASLWAEGEKKRNGVYQYAVSSRDLKARLIKKWGNAEDNLWVIGVSSPWVKKYVIISNKKINTMQYEIKIKYFWATSTGDSAPSITTLTIKKQGEFWRVTKAQ